MTLLELKKQVDDAVKVVGGQAKDLAELEVCIPLLGISGSNVGVKSVDFGFDEYHGKFLVSPKAQLVRYCPEAQSEPKNPSSSGARYGNPTCPKCGETYQLTGRPHVCKNDERQ